MNSETKSKIEKMVDETLKFEHMQAYQIENFTIEELDILAEYAKENDMVITLRAEHSNFHCGVLVQLMKRDVAKRFSDHI